MKFDFIPDSVSHFDNAYDVLKERGFIEQSTNEDEIRELLQNEKVKFYIGFDPTADCLHVGHFMQVIIMMYMQKYGHTPVVLIGGGTGMVGDPSGRTDMRKVMTIETIENNCNQFEKLFDKFLDFDDEWEYVGNEGVLYSGSSEQGAGSGQGCRGQQREMAAATQLHRLLERGRHAVQHQHDAARGMLQAENGARGRSDDVRAELHADAELRLYGYGA